MQDASDIFRARWSPQLHQEAQALRNALPALVGALASEAGIIAAWMAQRLTDALRAIETILPDQDFTAAIWKSPASPRSKCRKRPPDTKRRSSNRLFVVLHQHFERHVQPLAAVQEGQFNQRRRRRHMRADIPQ